MLHTTDFTPALEGSQFVRSISFGESKKPARVAIVVPCYNEAKRLDCGSFISFLAEHESVSLVFVNDGSADATLDVLAVVQAARPEQVEVLSLLQNSGKAEAVRTGMLHAAHNGAEFIGYWDADLATPLEAIPDFTKVLSRFDEVEVVFGSRRCLLGHRINRTFFRRCVSRACSALARLAVRLPVADTQCGAKLMRNTAGLKTALSSRFTAGWLFDVELFSRISARTQDRRRAFYEMPLSEWTEVAGSKVSGKAIVKSGFQMLRLIAQSYVRDIAAEGKAVGADAILINPAHTMHRAA